jgi:hypothetical protein
MVLFKTHFHDSYYNGAVKMSKRNSSEAVLFLYSKVLDHLQAYYYYFQYYYHHISEIIINTM